MTRIPLKDAASQLGCSPDNLRQAIARGSLKATKIGSAHRGEWYVSQEEIDRYFRENRRAS